MASITERMMGAARLDVATYTEVESDQTATSQAMLVVVISSVAAGIGAAGSGGAGVIGILGATALALVGWAAWAFIAYFVGTKFLAEPQTQADWGQLLRTLGFASSPGVLRVLGIIPVLGGIIGFLVTLWMLVAMVIAVREALDYQSTGRAVAVCLIGFVVYLFIVMGLAVMFGLAGAGAAALAGAASS
jgi:hypothetical protein